MVANVKNTATRKTIADLLGVFPQGLSALMESGVFLADFKIRPKDTGVAYFSILSG
jgi:hypothetical protein